MIRRHSLVWLHSVGENASPHALEWHRSGRPFIICRTRPGDELSFGFCLPGVNGGKPLTMNLSGAASDIRMIQRPPDFRDVCEGRSFSDLPEGVREILSSPPGGCIVRVVGSRMWEALTGLQYVRSSSDWDIVVDLSNFSDAPATVNHLARAGIPLDAELAFPGGGEVHWCEWQSGASPVLIKSLTGVRLCSREKCEDFFSEPRRSTEDGERFAPDYLADQAVQALLTELALYPKPGLVSPVDSGSHSDMDCKLLEASAEALRPFFVELALAGAVGAGFFQSLVPIGLRAESEMLRVTGGVNTHRGGIFALGLLVAAAARIRRADGAHAVRRELRSIWSEDLQVHAATESLAASHGGRIRKNTGVGGARREAAEGFPAVFDCALPHFQKGVADGLGTELAAIDTLFLLVATLDDTNLIHRGGTEGLRFARESADLFLKSGGVRSCGWLDRAVSIHHAFVARGLSPGGAADLLAGTLFLSAIHCAQD